MSIFFDQAAYGRRQLTDPDGNTWIPVPLDERLMGGDVVEQFSDTLWHTPRPWVAWPGGGTNDKRWTLGFNTPLRAKDIRAFTNRAPFLYHSVWRKASKKVRLNKYASAPVPLP
jgi:hypothetical protein